MESVIQLKPPKPSDLDAIRSRIGYRLPYHHPDVPFIALWSQKSGCTVILRWYLFQAYLLMEASSYEKVRLNMRLHRYEQDVFKARPGYRRDLMQALIHDKPVICFLRCPYQRAFSSYLQVNNPKLLRVAGRGDSSRILRLRQEILEHIHGPGIGIERQMSFAGYLDWLGAQAPNSVNRHHSPQYSVLHDHAEVNNFRLEQLADIAKRMERDLDLRSSHKHPKMFKSKHAVPKLEVEEGALGRILDEGVSMERNKRTPVPALSRSLLEKRPEGRMIADIFARDIDLYDSTPLL